MGCTRVEAGFVTVWIEGNSRRRSEQPRPEPFRSIEDGGRRNCIRSGSRLRDKSTTAKVVLIGSDSVPRTDVARTQPDTESESETGSQVDAGVVEEFVQEADVMAAWVDQRFGAPCSTRHIGHRRFGGSFLHTSLCHEKSSYICERSVQSP